MLFPKFSILVGVIVLFLGMPTGLAQVDVKTNPDSVPLMQNQTSPPYASVDDLIEVMFAQDSRVRLRNGALVDLATNALAGVDGVLQRLAWHEWYRICDVPEERLDEIQARGEANTGKPVYNLNNIYRLRIPKGLDVWSISKELEALPGVILARPVPKPMPLPNPPNYASCSGDTCQGYLRSASSTPVGIDADYAWTQTGGDGTGVTVCDLEYGWNYNHADITKAVGSQINPNPIFYPANADTNHGTAVIGELVSDNNGWGTTGICYGATLKTCGTVYNSSTNWDVPGAMAYAIAALSPGDVILLEQQWDYTGFGGYIPIEWWLNYSPNPQTFNGVYAAIVNAVSNGIHVVEAGGNGNVNTNGLSWYGNSGAIIVGAGGAYPGGTYPEGDLQRLSFSSYGNRFDLQGWGENVVTTGYGYLYNADGYNYWYTNIFAGTSSASPIVAGAVACCVGYWKTNISSTPPSAIYIRNVLKNTGTPQITPPNGNIGPRPNLQAAFAAFSAEWVDVTSGPLGDMGNGRGVAWGDYDNDGDLDLYLSNYGGAYANKLFRNDGNDLFVDATSGPLGDPGNGMSVVWGDYDNDGDLDLYLANYGSANKLFRNDGGGVFTDVTSGPLGDAGNGMGVAWGDYDNDGDLDIYLSNCGQANKLFRNVGGGIFVDATSGPLGDAGCGSGVAWGDYDNDGDLDLYLANYDNTGNKLFRNDGNGVFVDVTSGPLGGPGFCTGVAWGDYDNDGDLDLYIANYGSAGNRLLRNDGGGVFSDVTSGPLSGPQNSTSVAWGDYDNDGDLDLYVGAGGYPKKLLRNDGSGVFVDATSGPLGEASSTQGVAWGDCDNDGDLDLYVSNYGYANRLFLNQVGSKNNWLHVDLVGTVSNKSAIGARVRVRSGGISQIREISGSSGFLGQNSLTAAFGLGSATRVDTLEIRWPSGIVQRCTAVPIDKLLQIYESTFVRGDATGDGVIDISDVVYLLNYLFVGGPAPVPLAAGDANSDGVVDASDLVYLLNYLFVGGPPPRCG
jgi:hypothetical protein